MRRGRTVCLGRPAAAGCECGVVRIPRWCCGLAAGGVAVGLLTACGASSDPAPRSVAGTFTHAIADKNGAAACALLAPATRDELEQSAGTSCASAIVDEKLPDAGAPLASSAFGTMAQVSFGTDVVFLAEFPRGWRVMAAGCAPSPTPDAPYKCQLSGG
jgi:hypothetical protein